MLILFIYIIFLRNYMRVVWPLALDLTREVSLHLDNDTDSERCRVG